MAVAQNAHEWAVATINAKRMLQPSLWVRGRPPQPSVLIQSVIGQVFRPVSPMEDYSEEQPRFFPQSPEDEALIPIDELLGRYVPAEVTIRIFIKNIERYANKPLGCDPSDLEFLVRIHEYAHAIVHLGVSAQRDSALLNDRHHGECKTDWGAFLAQRNHAYAALNSACHEMLAQALSWSILNTISSDEASRRLLQLFPSLMARQPKEYRLPESFLNVATEINWPFVLDCLQHREGPDLPDSGSPRDAIECLILMAASK